ncbi:KICSTOR subunit 2-like isoform X2 [Physella acuta]|nr:KICSTOR subunit 2-like isoform X2 [Physella acuta]XP_059140752.1 KICSTOR subunit 2-like isoform X2 [Physella acuta]XP_059140753.1 KICSTOR subunit 2-like isoform X2 [Physella acuta]XP_059140754.1 KICSTOR subunit 2-like isoform X2 [Physella acuta]
MSSRESVLNYPASPSISHEESVLEHYFVLVSQANYDKAKELVDNEKDGHKFSNAAFWGETLQCLSQLAIAEKNYNNLVFLGQKRFTQIVRSKDSAKSIYSMLLHEFQRMENSLSPGSLPLESGESKPVNESDQLLAHISGQLFFFVRARLKMIEFYEQLSSLGGMRNWMSFEDLVMMAEEIMKDHMKGFHHPLVASLKAVFSLEVESLCHLLHAQIHISTWDYLASVLQLHLAHSKLNTWGKMTPVKEVKSSFGRTSGKTSPFPPLHAWLLKLKGILLSKFGFYFYHVLSKQTIPAEMKANLAKAPEDFFGKVQAFQRKSDATNIYLILEAKGLSSRVGEGGYHHPNKYAETTQGMDTYPPIFSYPMERSINAIHWPALVMLLSSTENSFDKLHYFYDKPTEKRPYSSYFITRVDVRIWLVVVFESKKNEKDSVINTFMTDLAVQLRCQNFMYSLKSFARS